MQRLRERDTSRTGSDAAARHHRSLEEEARELLRCAVAQADEPQLEENLTDIARRLFGPEHGADLDIPPRDATQDRPPLDFSGPEWDVLDAMAEEQDSGPAA